MSRRPTHVCLAIAALAVAASGCSSSNKGSLPAPSTTTTSAAPTNNPVVVHGNATLDGVPFDSQFVGAVVLNDGLATPCQSTLLPVSDGRYEVTVLADGESRGCGAPGAAIVPWVYAHDRYIYSTNSLPWPANGSTATFAPTYSSSKPAGAAPVLAQFSGAVYKADGVPASAGTRVEAFIRNTRCGVASVRNTVDFNGYVLAVVGPASIPDCTRGAPVSFRVNGRTARHAPVRNTPPGRRDALDLRMP
jgi:hypothetical protein